MVTPADWNTNLTPPFAPPLPRGHPLFKCPYCIARRGNIVRSKKAASNWFFVPSTFYCNFSIAKLKTVYKES
ncbi:hypothetical protein J6590_054383 [Homalodisca vitripennis]|nr:hypothetical protein J6590_054383 [Homalodisca vitripennis]